MKDEKTIAIILIAAFTSLFAMCAFLLFLVVYSAPRVLLPGSHTGTEIRHQSNTGSTIPSRLASPNAGLVPDSEV